MKYRINTGLYSIIKVILLRTGIRSASAGQFLTGESSKQYIMRRGSPARHTRQYRMRHPLLFDRGREELTLLDMRTPAIKLTCIVPVGW